jgi:hypothetical protein
MIATSLAGHASSRASRPAGASGQQLLVSRTSPIVQCFCRKLSVRSYYSDATRVSRSIKRAWG